MRLALVLILSREAKRRPTDLVRYLAQPTAVGAGYDAAEEIALYRRQTNVQDRGAQYGNFECSMCVAVWAADLSVSIFYLTRDSTIIVTNITSL